jgi:hypothetical protein
MKAIAFPKCQASTSIHTTEEGIVRKPAVEISSPDQ